jgi:ribosomal protein S27AE
MIWRANIIDVLVSLIVRLCISFSFFDLLFSQHDRHDRLSATHIRARKRGRTCALASARALSCDVIMLIMLISIPIPGKESLTTYTPVVGSNVSLGIFTDKECPSCGRPTFLAPHRDPATRLPRPYCVRIIDLMGNKRTNEGERGPVSLSKPNYRHNLAHYAALYETSDRTVRRWVTIGRKANKEKNLQRDNPAHLPPLDRPEKMEDWWVEHLKSDLVPEKLCELAHPISATNGSDDVEAGLEIDHFVGKDLQDALQDARRHRDVVSRRLAAAQRSNNVTLVARHAAAYEKLSAASQRFEELAMKDRAFSKKFVSLDKIWDEIDGVLYMLKQFRSTMSKRILDHLRDDLSPELAQRMTKAIEIERAAEDTILRDLKLEGTTGEELARLGFPVDIAGVEASS